MNFKNRPSTNNKLFREASYVLASPKPAGPAHPLSRIRGIKLYLRDYGED